MSEEIDYIGAFKYLDGLRKSGAVNMYGAGEYIIRDLDLNRTQARTVLGHWMDTFHPEVSVEQRLEDIKGVI